MPIESTANFRKFLFWLRYDGSRFSHMAKLGDATIRVNNGTSLYRFFEMCLARMLGTEQLPEKIQTSIISRTDAKVHSLRSPIIIWAPDEYTWFNRSDKIRHKFVNEFNELIHQTGYGQAMALLKIDPVAQGFHPIHHVAYRRYVYRLRIAHTEEAFKNRLSRSHQTLSDLTEMHYSWTVPPQFNVEKAERICALLRRPGLNFASFYSHRKCEREKGQEYMCTTLKREFRLLRIGKGEPYAIPDPNADYLNFDFVAQGFNKQQIRRMMSLIVSSACGWTREDPKRLTEYLLRDPDPLKFHWTNLRKAPPQGLFLADVVYDPRMFTHPVPAYKTSWDRLDAKEDGLLEHEEGKKDEMDAENAEEMGEEQEDEDDFEEGEEQQQYRRRRQAQ